MNLFIFESPYLPASRRIAVQPSAILAVVEEKNYGSKRGEIALGLSVIVGRKSFSVTGETFDQFVERLNDALIG